MFYTLGEGAESYHRALTARLLEIIKTFKYSNFYSTHILYFVQSCSTAKYFNTQFFFLKGGT